MKGIRLTNLLENKQVAIALSVVLAVIFWFVVVMYFDPESNMSISDIPITVNTSNTQAQSLGLEVSNIQPQIATVDLTGKRYKMAKLTKDDIAVTAVISSVTSSGTYTLDLTATTLTKDSDYSIQNIRPKQVNVTFDKVSTKNVTLEAQAPNVKVGNGYLMETPTASPETLEVQGPDQYIKQLDKVVLRNEQSITATASQTLEATIHFYAEDGSELSSSYFTYQKNIHFTITVPVYKQKTVPLTFKYKNAPSTLDTSKLQYQLNPEQITVAGNADAVENLSEISLGYIDIREVDIGKSFSFNIPIPAGFKSVDSITQATVTFSGEGWSSKTLDVSDIRTVNQPAGYTIDIKSQLIHDVKFVGLSDAVENLVSGDLVATVDFSSQQIQTGTLTVEVRIDVVSKDGVWAVGVYTCVVEVHQS